MRILVVGSGGREHALAWRLRQGGAANEIFAAPGNGGTAMEGVNCAVSDSDVGGLVHLARDKRIDLVAAGPELPLVEGLTEALAREGIPCFGPDAFAARLEGSKAFAKNLMRETGVPTADFAVFTDYAKAREHVLARDEPMVVKADGLAAGKGVVVARTRGEALAALEDMMVKKIYGPAGDAVIVEDALSGEEASFLAFCDGQTIVPLPACQDHKPVGEGDAGPNTGGMGAYCPAPVLPESEYGRMAELAIRPIVASLAAKGHPFKGVLYAGLMMTKDGPYVLEYNVRFGDPECQPLLMRLQGDLAEIMLACVQGRLDATRVGWKPETAICVVMAAKGYPGNYPKGMEIFGLDAAEKLDGVKVFQAGTRLAGGRIVSSGGRILGVTALGMGLAAAKSRAYAAIEKISYDNAYYRRDIGDKGLVREGK
ncbi:MAG: phosphoribosylamine--glycine ligase [Desulfovibrionaceae bacterium]|nr:phosphoribosylamine--glycine ligase [Desulfovibrionaceae bacterium]MBF0513561.1 phosphoribosylamine--glycine ligase [Desulfovibrionaceae bacterium]